MIPRSTSILAHGTLRPFSTRTMETWLPLWATIMAGTLVLPSPLPTTRPSALNITTQTTSRTCSTVTSRVSTSPVSTWASITIIAERAPRASRVVSLLARRYPFHSVQIPLPFTVAFSPFLWISPFPLQPPLVTTHLIPYPAVFRTNTPQRTNNVTRHPLLHTSAPRPANIFPGNITRSLCPISPLSLPRLVNEDLLSHPQTLHFLLLVFGFTMSLHCLFLLIVHEAKEEKIVMKFLP
ncbi:hypothetical protein M408DRAFT_193851, partial [Serendipita vermifera MAFF 305830]